MHSRYLTVLFLFLPFSTEVMAAQPFQIREQNPLTLVYGLPLPGETPTQEKAERFDISLLYTVSNTTNIQRSNNDLLVIDGETTVVDLIYRQTLSETLDFSIHLPWISHGGGFLDGFIEGFHDTFGLPNGERSQVEDDQLLFRFVRQGEEILDIDQSQSGIGDLRLGLDYRVSPVMFDGMSLHAMLKLPTGDSDHLTGSGAADLSLWISGEKRFSTAWEFSAHAGVIFVGEGDLLADLQRSQVLFVNSALQWQFLPSIQLLAQLDCHSAFYDHPDIDLLGSSTMLTFGGRYQLTPQHSIDLALAEDIEVGSSPDVQFHLGWHYRHH
jgi:hypothetical protein